MWEDNGTTRISIQKWNNPVHALLTYWNPLRANGATETIDTWRGVWQEKRNENQNKNFQ